MKTLGRNIKPSPSNLKSSCRLVRLWKNFLYDAIGLDRNCIPYEGHITLTKDEALSGNLLNAKQFHYFQQRAVVVDETVLH